MKWTAVARKVFFVVAGILLAVSLLGIAITGPIVVRVSRLESDLDVSPDDLRSSVETLCKEFAPRDRLHHDNLERAADWIEARFRETGLEVESQTYVAGGESYRNVIAVRRGIDPAAEAIVVGAHYDAVEGSPGAGNNASGVAVLLEIARTLPHIRTRRTQYFVAFGTGAAPFTGGTEMGSYLFARKLVDEGTEVSYMISVDLPGFLSVEDGDRQLPPALMQLLYPGGEDFIAVLGDLRSGRTIERVKRGLMYTGDLRIQSFRAPPRWAPVLRSDHGSFRRMGLPGVQVTDTACRRFPRSRAAEDTPSKLDYDRLARLVESFHGLLWEGQARLPEHNVAPTPTETPTAPPG